MPRFASYNLYQRFKNSLYVAYCLLREPKIFSSLILIPFLFSLYLALVELGLSIFIISMFMAPTIGRGQSAFEADRSDSPYWKYLYGQVGTLEKLRFCSSPDNTAPISEEVRKQVTTHCPHAPVTVTIKAIQYDPWMLTIYRRLFDGVVPQIQLCNHCPADLTIDLTAYPRSNTVSSVSGIAVLKLLNYNAEYYSMGSALGSIFGKLSDFLGHPYLFLADMNKPIIVGAAVQGCVISLTLAFFLLIGIFVTLWSHRRVLDFFAKNGVLLPLAAACNPRLFYPAVWWLTLARAAAFFAAAFPLFFGGMTLVLNRNLLISRLFGGEFYSLLLWLATVICALISVVLLISLAELKQRQAWMLYFLRYLPLICATIGAFVWTVSILYWPVIGAEIRTLLHFLPFFGIWSLVVAPVFQPPAILLVSQLLISIALTYYFAKLNSRWFASHLEEL